MGGAILSTPARTDDCTDTEHTVPTPSSYEWRRRRIDHQMQRINTCAPRCLATSPVAILDTVLTESSQISQK